MRQSPELLRWVTVEASHHCGNIRNLLTFQDSCLLSEVLLCLLDPVPNGIKIYYYGLSNPNCLQDGGCIGVAVFTLTNEDYPQLSNMLG